MNAFDREIWARTGWMEARGESADGQRAVMHAINNRYKSGKWYAKFNGKTSIAIVCLYDQQFSCWNASKQDDNREAMAVLPMDDSHLEWFRNVADAVFGGTDPSPVGEATHYFDERLPEWPAWADQATMVVQIGHHRFYSDVP